MLSVQNYGQTNQMVNFKARKIPNAPKNLKKLYEQRANYVKKEYPNIIAKLDKEFANGKIGFEEFNSRMNNEFKKLTECLKKLGKQL